MKYSKDIFGSRLEITIFSDDVNDSGITESFFLVSDFEKKYSRFLTDNILSEINSGDIVHVSSEIFSLLELSVKVSKLTQGYFDITLLPLLENAGYGIEKNIMQESIGYKNIELKNSTVQLKNSTVQLKNNVQVEFGSCGKGYMLDLIYNILKRYHASFIINFGGDIRVGGYHNIYLEDPLNTQENIGNIFIQNISIASSSGNRRKIGDGHHLINVKDKVSQNDKLIVYVTHKSGLFADIFATALFVTPLDLSIKVLESVVGLEALIIGIDGKIYKSQGFQATLTI